MFFLWNSNERLRSYSRTHLEYFDVGGFQTTPEGSFFVVNDYDADKFSCFIKDLDVLGLHTIY